MGLILLIVLILLLFGGLPRWGYHSYVLPFRRETESSLGGKR